MDTRTDLFSFAAELYEMATGRQAFQGNTHAVIFEAILNKTPQPLSQLNPMLPTELGRVIDKALQKDRAERYQNASDLRTDLKRLKRETDSGRPAVVPAIVARASSKATGGLVALAKQTDNFVYGGCCHCVGSHGTDRNTSTAADCRRSANQFHRGSATREPLG